MSSSPSKPDPLAGWPHPEPPFHAGERAAQARYGLRERMEQVGRRVIRGAMPDQHREFFAELPFVIVGSVDREGWPWATLVRGAPGFVHSPEPHVLAVGAGAPPQDPLAHNLALGARLGVLGIQFHTRRRNRMNGRVIAATPAGFRLEVEQSFGNCPKYIKPRGPDYPFLRAAADASPALRREGAHLSAQARSLIERADAFFIASVAPALATQRDPARGVDVSHRGGPPGFVRVQEQVDPPQDERALPGHALDFVDYAGNYFFNTLGNLSLEPRAGLLFVDYDTGAMLSLSGQTELFWARDDPGAPPSANARAEQETERSLRFHVRAGWSYG